MSKRRRIASACWHVHGHFFDALYGVNKKAVIVSRGNKITNDYGNWEDTNIGSQMYPYYFSDACNCFPHVDVPEHIPTEQEDKYKEKKLEKIERGKNGY